tara:strand:+ start:1000 stop:1371 length:372 start_codon:yes stop_codon:yes gene_type:complete
MTTKSLKPRPQLPKTYDEAEALYKKAGKVLGKPKKRTTTKYKTMTEQKPLVNDTINKVKSLPSLPEPYVQSHLSDIQLISRDALLKDFKNRMEINNRELGYAWGDFKNVLTQAKELYKSKVKS